MKLFFSLFILLFSFSLYSYQPSHQVPKNLKGVGITEKLGNKVDLNLTFKDEKGKTVPLKTYFKDRPVLLSIAYYECPTLCNYHLTGLLDAFKDMNWSIGNQFEFVVVSMDHREHPSLAERKRNSFLKEYQRPGSEKGWHFLTGTKENIKALADQVGFGFRWVPEQKEYAHASAAYVITPQGEISRYFYGVQFFSKDLRLSLLEASKGTIGNLVDQLILYCFRFNPNTNKYTIYAMNLMKLAALVTVLLLLGLLLPVWLRKGVGHS